MPTSRIFHVLTFRSRILTDNFFAIVTDKEKRRSVHETGMYRSRHFAASAAKEWAHTSSSKLAKSLEKQGG